MSTNKHSRRAEQRAARALAAERNISYAQAVELMRADESMNSVQTPTEPDAFRRLVEGEISTDDYVENLDERVREQQRDDEKSRSATTSTEPTEDDYRKQIQRLCELTQAWSQSMEDDDDGEGADYACEAQMSAAARDVLAGLRDDGHRRRVHLDVVEVCRNELSRFAQFIDSYEELALAYEMTPTHSRYEADDELRRALKSAVRFLERADDPSFRKSFSPDPNPFYQPEKVPVPVPDPSGERVCGIRQGAVLRDRHTGELRTLLTSAQKGETEFGPSVRLSDPRDDEQPQPGDSSSFGGFWCLADQLLMLFEAVDSDDEAAA